MKSSAELENFAAYQQAAERGLQWCLARQHPDGSLQMEQECIDCLYKFPVTFATLGRSMEAGKLLNWLEQHALTASGDLTLPAGKFLHPWHKQCHMYANSWIIIGAQRAGFFKLADRCMNHLLQYQNRTTGGFQSGRVDSDSSGVCDTTITSQAGICALYTGHHDQAERGAEWLCRVAEMQDENGPLFYFCTDRHGQLVKTPAADGSPLWTWLDSRCDGQCYWYLGIAAAFLCLLYDLRGNPRHLDCARRYLEFLLRAKGSITSLASGKFGYAAALMYRLTGESRYRDAAVAHADWLVSCQKPDGRWTIDAPDHPWYFVYDFTAEMAYWLTEIMKYLAASPGPAVGSRSR